MEVGTLIVIQAEGRDVFFIGVISGRIVLAGDDAPGMLVVIAFRFAISVLPSLPLDQ